MFRARPFGQPTIRMTPCRSRRHTRLRQGQPNGRTDTPVAVSLGRVNLRDGRCQSGHNEIVGEWSDLAETLVELDLAIEELDSWATRDEDVAVLKRLEELRDQVQNALSTHHVSRRLRQRLQAGHTSEPGPVTTDPRD